MAPLIKVLDNISESLSKLLIWVGYALISISGLLVFIEVITRYGFGVSHAMAAETSKYFLIVCAFLLAGVFVRRDEHFCIVVVVNYLKGKTKKICRAITIIVNLTVSILIFAMSFTIVIHDYQTQSLTESFTFKIWWLHFSSLIIGLGFLSFSCIVEFLKFFFGHDTQKKA